MICGRTRRLYDSASGQNHARYSRTFAASGNYQTPKVVKRGPRELCAYFNLVVLGELQGELIRIRGWPLSVTRDSSICNTVMSTAPFFRLLITEVV